MMDCRINIDVVFYSCISIYDSGHLFKSSFLRNIMEMRLWQQIFHVILSLYFIFNFNIYINQCILAIFKNDSEIEISIMKRKKNKEYVYIQI